MKLKQICHDTSQDASEANADTNTGETDGDASLGGTPSCLYSAARDTEQITQPPDGRPQNSQPQWRKDFPIDWPQDHYVSRRDFAKFMVLASGAFTLGQLWIGMQNIWRKHRGMPPIQKIALLSTLPIGGSLVFRYPGTHDDCVLIRIASEKLVAYSQKCTHLSCAVVPKVTEGVLRCPCHEGVFDLYTGRRIAGPPPRPLPRITIDIRGDEVYATGVERRTV